MTKQRGPSHARNIIGADYEESETHMVGEVKMRHVCSHCASNGYDNPHTLRACNRKKAGASNAFYNRANYEEKRDNKLGRNHNQRKSDSSTEN